MGAKIEFIDYYYPENKLTNDLLKLEFPDYDFTSFENKVGIKNRYIADAETTALDLAQKACEKLFLRFDKSKIDYVIYCTQSPDYILPTTACILQNRLELNRNIGAFDFNLGCSGFTYGVSLAKSLIGSGQAKCVLLVTAETYSKFLHPKDRSNRSIFGDAAAATVISYCEEECINEFKFGTDGTGAEQLIVRNGAAKNKYSSEAEEIVYGTDNTYTENNLYMNGPAIFNFTSDVIPLFTQEVLAINGLQKEDVSQFILHQANAFILNFIRKKLKVEQERFFIDLEDGGNTVSCTIPIALKKYTENKTSSNQENILLVGFGVGLSWCGGVIKISGKL